jgi:hypothetical protein
MWICALRACEDDRVSAGTDERERFFSRHPRLGTVMREGERVTPLELFFDLRSLGPRLPLQGLRQCASSSARVARSRWCPS